MNDILQNAQHYWVTAQSELSTDVLFKSRRQLSELYPELLSHSTVCFGAKEVMTFLGRKLRGSFEEEIVSDLSDFSGRIPGCRIKHRVTGRSATLIPLPLVRQIPLAAVALR